MTRLTLFCLLLIFSMHRAYSQDNSYQDDYYNGLITKAEKKASEDGRNVLETGRTMTLKNKEILPGSCWDYANAVYDRAGYSWGKREDVFKSAKTGPYADVSKIKYGDWLYYVNHSYNNIEHSAIFIEWIDIENKLALMLSYGGESRREPARYIPYDLSSVYGITRANSELGAGKATEKTKTTGTASAVASNVNKSSTTSTTTANKTMATPSESVSGGTVNGMKVESLKFGVGVDKMEIVGEGVSFSGSAGKVYCWMRISGGMGKTVKVKWYLNGNAIGETPLDIRSSPMRTYAYRTVTGRKGNWKIEILDPSGAILHSAGFTVN
ncbi:DUF2914 domain-containing protein [bacterium]|nr:MAG: DUF2914 domain-containing protein [bacterium]